LSRLPSKIIETDCEGHKCVTGLGVNNSARTNQHRICCALQATFSLETIVSSSWSWWQKLWVLIAFLDRCDFLGEQCGFEFDK